MRAARPLGKPPKLRQVLGAVRVGLPRRLCGDELRDAEAARAVGVAFAAVSWGSPRPEALARHAPDRLFASVAEIAPRVCRGARARAVAQRLG